jgi:hypothetical protein
MSKQKNKITKEDMATIKRGARRDVEIEVGIGINRKHDIFVDRKKQISKDKCRTKYKDE